VREAGLSGISIPHVETPGEAAIRRASDAAGLRRVAFDAATRTSLRFINTTAQAADVVAQLRNKKESNDEGQAS
jgi:hypothetical protein